MWIYQVIGRSLEDDICPCYDELFDDYLNALGYLDNLMKEFEMPPITEEESFEEQIIREDRGWRFTLKPRWVRDKYDTIRP